MNTTAQQETHGTRVRKSFALSKDGDWRSFLKVPRLLQYVSSGTYYARIKVNGKVIRHSCRRRFKTGKDVGAKFE